MTDGSSTHLNQHTGWCAACSIAFFSKFSTKKFAIAGESGEPIATPSVCSYKSPSNQKYMDVSTCLNNARTSPSKWWLRSSIESTIGTLVKRDNTSKLTNYSKTFKVTIFLIPPIGPKSLWCSSNSHWMDRCRFCYRTKAVLAWRYSLNSN